MFTVVSSNCHYCSTKLIKNAIDTTGDGHVPCPNCRTLFEHGERGNIARHQSFLKNVLELGHGCVLFRSILWCIGNEEAAFNVFLFYSSSP